VIPAMRKYYNDNLEFRSFIDNINPDNFAEAADFVTSSIKENTGEYTDLKHLVSMLDVDFCVMFQNLIQAPVRLSVSENMIKKMYDESGFSEPERLKRYVVRQNIRKFLAPFHYEHQHPLSELFWGSGNLEFIAQKHSAK